MAHGQTHILNESIAVADEAKGDLDTAAKNIRVLITKLKGAHMNEGEYELGHYYFICTSVQE